MSVANLIGTDEKAYEEATGEVTGEFKCLEAGAYKATVSQVLKWTNKFKNQSMQYTVNITSEKRTVSFMKEINSTMLDKATNKEIPNGGYSDRMKQFIYATGVDPEKLSIAKDKVKVKSFGAEYDAEQIIGFGDAEIIAEVLLMDNINLAEGMPYKLQNNLAGVLAADGTDASGENKLEAFTDKCKTRPITPYDGFVKKAATATEGTVDKDAAAETEAAGF